MRPELAVDDSPPGIVFEDLGNNRRIVDANLVGEDLAGIGITAGVVDRVGNVEVEGVVGVTLGPTAAEGRGICPDGRRGNRGHRFPAVVRGDVCTDASTGRAIDAFADFANVLPVWKRGMR